MCDPKSISLHGGERYLTRTAIDAFMVRSGSVLVYIVPLAEGKPLRRSLCCICGQGEIIPGFFYTDMEGTEWAFCLVAEESAEIGIIENGSTKILRKKFAEKANIRNFDIEGFNGGLADLYRINTVTEDSFIIKSQRDREQTSKDILRLINDSFRRKNISAPDEKTGNAIYDTLNFVCQRKKMKIAPFEKVKQACGDDIQLSDIVRVSHFSCRKVLLEEKWYKQDAGELVAFAEKGGAHKPVALIPHGNHSYYAYDADTGSAYKVNSHNCGDFGVHAYSICKPLPARRLCMKDIAEFCASGTRAFDIVVLAVLTVLITLTELLVPIMSQRIYDEYIPLGAENILLQLGSLMTAFLMADVMFSIVNNLTKYRISSRAANDLQNAVFDRIFNLPESFFREYESADLAQRIMGANKIASLGITSVLLFAAALVNLAILVVRMGLYSAGLMALGLLFTAVYAVILYIINNLAIKHTAQSEEYNGRSASLLYQFINGIEKIRITGVEERAILEFLKPYIKQRNSTEKVGNITHAGKALTVLFNGLVSAGFYLLVIVSDIQISIGGFIAFSAVFGAFFAAAMQMEECLIQLKRLKPYMTRIKPVMDALPEYDEAKEIPSEVSGSIELSNVSFAYEDGAPNVIDGLSLNINQGEYIGIVGASGCGKSTLLKLLLGFEKPQCGKVYYDNKDLESLDKRELRKKIGVVLQDGRLISGSIFENITITNSKAGKAEVEEVVSAVGLKDDIDSMPMGLNTVLSENCGTISGGQQQRILIARALISKPNILFFDEATSALDNATQNMVCETLEKIPATRVVIAHRLSTIINCDRIIVMDNGRIAEEGTYEELMHRDGLFRQFASRQMA